MRTSNPIIMYLPSLLVEKLDQCLKDTPPGFPYKLVHFYYVLHYIILLKNALKKIDYVNLNRQKLRRITVSNIDRYIKYLENGELIISDESYQVGSKSKAYKLNGELLIGAKKIEIQPGSKLFKKITQNQHNKRAHHNRLKPFLASMRAKFMQVELDYHSAREWAQNCPNKANELFHLTAIQQIQDRRFRYFKRNKTNNRLDTNFTNLKKELRNFILGDFVSIDLSNSQPFFLSQLIKHITHHNPKPLCWYFKKENLAQSFGKKAIQHIAKTHQNEKKTFLVNLSEFERAVNSGQLYEELMQSYPGAIDRKRAKEIVFKVIFSRNEIYKSYKRFVPYAKDKYIFSEVYPHIFECVKTFKQNNHVKLAVFLQKLESYIFIDLIAKTLVRAGIPPLTIHDSIVIERQHQDKALQIMKKIFLQNFAVIPTFKVGQLNFIINENTKSCNKASMNS